MARVETDSKSSCVGVRSTNRWLDGATPQSTARQPGSRGATPPGPGRALLTAVQGLVSIAPGSTAAKAAKDHAARQGPCHPCRRSRAAGDRRGQSLAPVGYAPQRFLPRWNTVSPSIRWACTQSVTILPTLSARLKQLLAQGCRAPSGNLPGRDKTATVPSRTGKSWCVSPAVDTVPGPAYRLVPPRGHHSPWRP